MRESAAVLCLLLAVLASPPLAGARWPRNASGCDEPAGGVPFLPCSLQKDLLAAMRGEATRWRWQEHLDADFSPSWDSGNYGSNNLPVLAAAIALWSPSQAPGFDAVAWWTTFLDCQTGVACAVDSDLKYMRGHEILSPIYDAYVVGATAAVHYWAATRGQGSGLGPRAAKYLRMTAALYALAAGTGPARIARYDRFEPVAGESPEPACALSCGDASRLYRRFEATMGCHADADGTLRFDGPFLAMAGARSQRHDPCDSDSDPLLVRAIDWPGVTRTRESREQGELLDHLEAGWGKLGRAENLYGNDPARRMLLRHHVRGLPHDPGTLTAILRGARFVREYRFLVWPGGERATMLLSNPETCGHKGWCTAAMMGVKYTPATQEAHLLYPWPGQTRSCVTAGATRLLPDAAAPVEMVARSIDPERGEAPGCEHGDTTVAMPLPPEPPLFQVVLGPTFDACVDCEPGSGQAPEATVPPSPETAPAPERGTEPPAGLAPSP
jgi:hypothetical protein